jgi:cystathionine beta-lyase
MASRFGWNGLDVARVMILTDLIQAQIALITAFSKPGEAVLIQTPAYPGFAYTIADTGRRAVLHPMIDMGERFELDNASFLETIPDDLRIILLCHPQNPTGRVLTKTELAPIAQVAIERDLIVISDEIHSDLTFAGEHVPFAKMFPEAAEGTVTLYAATKSFSISGLSNAVMHFGSKELHDRFESRVRPHLLGSPAVTGLWATLAAWEESSDWLAELVSILSSRRDYMLGRLADKLPAVRAYSPEATYFLWADFSAYDLPTAPAEFLLERAKVVAGEGGHFGPGFEAFARFIFATTEEIIDEKVDRIAAALAGISLK